MYTVYGIHWRTHIYTHTHAYISIIIIEQQTYIYKFQRKLPSFSFTLQMKKVKRLICGRKAQITGH